MQESVKDTLTKKGYDDLKTVYNYKIIIYVSKQNFTYLFKTILQIMTNKRLNTLLMEKAENRN